MRINRKLILFFGLIIISFTAYSQQYDAEDDFIFENNKEEVGDRGYRTLPEIIITGYKGTRKNVRIPPQIQNLPVVGIGSGAFRDKQLTNVVIPNSIRYIGHGAFLGNKLTDLVIPDGVVNIGERAFAYNQLTSVSFPKNEIYIGYEAFRDNLLTDIKLPENLDGGIVGRAFESNRLTSITIPDGVKGIGLSGFANNPLTTVILPNSVNFLAPGAFQSTQLTRITIGKNVEFFARRSGDIYFTKEFDEFYLHMVDCRAGTYIFKNDRWQAAN